MKHLKMLGLLVMAAASLMAFASNASAASVLTSPAGTEFGVGKELKSSAAETLTLKASVFTVTCTESEVNGSIAESTATSAAGPITTLSYGGCNAEAVTTLANGSLSINDAGEVTAKENEVTVRKIGVSCIYGGGAGGTVVGTLTGGTTATLTISAELPKQAGSGGLCAAKAAWSGKYKVTSPDTLLVT